MFECGLKKREFSNITDEQLDTEVLALTKEFPFNGELMLISTGWLKFLSKQ